MIRTVILTIVAFFAVVWSGCASGGQEQQTSASQSAPEAMKKLEDWKQIQNDLVKIHQATMQYALDFKLSKDDPDTIPSIELLVEKDYFRQMLVPPVAGTKYVPQATWDGYPTWSGTPPKGMEKNYAHPDAP